MNNKILNLKEKLETLTGQRVLLQENNSSEIKSAVAIVINSKGEVLMGTCNNKDDRYGKLCFPGGGIEKGETPYKAAEREAFEEAGVIVRCSPMPWLVFEELPSVAFVLCKFVKGAVFPNEEFQDLAWHDYNKVSQDKLYKNNFNALMHFKR